MHNEKIPEFSFIFEFPSATNEVQVKYVSFILAEG